MLKKMLKPVFMWLYDYTIFRILYTFIETRYHVHIKRHFVSHKYDALKVLQNKYTGKRVFLVANGPSLTVDDLNKLTNEYSFGLNSIIKLYDKTSWRPTFYGICDGSAFYRIKDDLNKSLTSELAFYNDYTIREFNYSNAIPVPTLSGWCCNNDLRSLHLKPSKPYGLTSDDATRYIYAGAHVGHFCLQLCFFLGFKEIYLLGTDCSNIGKYAKGTEYHGSLDDLNEKDFVEWMMADYESDKKFAEAHGIKIYNATRGGALELFERVDLDEVLK